MAPRAAQPRHVPRVDDLNVSPWERHQPPRRHAVRQHLRRIALEDEAAANEPAAVIAPARELPASRDAMPTLDRRRSPHWRHGPAPDVARREDLPRHIFVE